MPLFGGPLPHDAPETRTRKRLRVLITVKAAPNPSTSYGETVCVAGLRFVEDGTRWVRLYPLDLRHTAANSAFRKYDIVELYARPAAADSRVESWKPEIPSIQVVGRQDQWKDRMPWLGPHATDTMCSLAAGGLTGGPSLGLVRARVSDLLVEPHPGWTAAEQAKIESFALQPSLLPDDSPQRDALEAPRYRVKYRWSCPEQGCSGHTQTVLDWEVVAHQRRLPPDDATAHALIRRRWLDEICGADREVMFYVGNQAARHQIFSILGVVYPKR